MQIAPSIRTVAPTTTPIAPTDLRHVATTDDGKHDVFAGKVLRSGVTNIALTGRELLNEYFARPQRHDHELSVGFLRNGDAWDAVELLAAAPGTTPQRMLVPAPMHPAPGVALDAVWLLADYGGDYSKVVLPQVV